MKKFYENIIIGAGPAGLQCAYYFQKYNINYIIIEKEDKCGSFFSKYPLSNNLISINKKYTGSENEDFNLRHDWNSLLNDEKHYFTDYSNDYYPKREEIVNYLNDFLKNNKLNIVFNKNVHNIEKQDNNYYIYIKDLNEIYYCNKLIIATGLSEMIKPNFEINVKEEIKHYGEYYSNFFLDESNLEEFKNKQILLLGGGNASYELGNILNKYAQSITIIGKNNYRELASITHYSGDIRSIYLPFMDTFLLKSLNAIDNFCSCNCHSNIQILQKNSNEKYKLINNKENFIIGYFDKIIFCTGWRFNNNIFNFDIDLTIQNKYPSINNNFESTNNTNLYFIGSLMHSIDFKKSSGGFIHGFRYLIKSFINENYKIEYKNKIFTLNFDKNIESPDYNNITIINFTNFIIERINSSSAMYQMFGYFSDTFYYNKNFNQIIYFYDIPEYKKIYNDENIFCFVITLEFGNKIENINELYKKLSYIGNENKSSYLHPILKIYNNNKLIDIIYFDENLYANFTDKTLYVDKLERILKSYFY